MGKVSPKCQTELNTLGPFGNIKKNYLYLSSLKFHFIHLWTENVDKLHKFEKLTFFMFIKFQNSGSKVLRKCQTKSRLINVRGSHNEIYLYFYPLEI